MKMLIPLTEITANNSNHCAENAITVQIKGKNIFGIKVKLVLKNVTKTLINVDIFTVSYVFKKGITITSFQYWSDFAIKNQSFTFAFLLELSHVRTGLYFLDI